MQAHETNHNRPLPIRALSALLSGIAAFVLALIVTYIAGTGTLPNDAELEFLADNWRLFPAHLAQTAPVLITLLSLATLLLSAGAAILAYRTDRHLRAWWPVYTLVLAAAMVLGIRASASTDAGLKKQFAQEIVPPTEPVGDYLTQLPAKTPYTPNDAKRRINVIVILAESLRHDLLTTHADAAPFLNRLAKQGLAFEYAYATASHSNLTDLAFWYSQYPYRGQGFETYKPTDAWRGTSMFDAFKASGYTSGYISSQNEKWGWMINWLKTPGVDYFFHSEDFAGSTWENHDDEPGLAALIKNKVATAGKVEDSETLAIAADWLEKNAKTRPVMLGMNLQNTHYSYVMPKGFQGPYQPSELGFKAVYYTWPKEHAHKVRNRYLNAVRGMDVALEAFAKRLQRNGIWDDALVVILGDNGEAFHEHGFGNHSGPLYDEATRTLAIIKPPANSGIPASVVNYPVSHIDLAASTLDLAGLPIPGTFQGIPYPRARERPVFMYANAFVRQFGVVEWPWKLLVTEKPVQNIELYDLSADPGERTNVFEQQMAVTREMLGDYMFWRESQFRYYRESRYAKDFPPTYAPWPRTQTP